MDSLEIMHVDMDAFFASVEQQDRPELRGKPVIVGGTGLENRGVVSAASYEAREYGVHSAMPLVQARELCPRGIYLPVRKKRYNQVSREIFEIFHRFTPAVEKLSIDEAFLDVSGCHRLFGSSREIGHQLKDMIREKTGITASLGLAPNKFLAKLASSRDKPDGFVVVEPQAVDEFLQPLPVSCIWGIGAQTETVLQEMGVSTIADLRQISLQDLRDLFGKNGERLYHLARGIDRRQVQPEDETKSLSHEQTFARSITDRDQLLAHLLDLSQRVVRRLRCRELQGSTVFVKIRYDDFRTLTRSQTLESPIQDTTSLYEVGRKLIERDQLDHRPVRLLGIGLENLENRSKKQLSLFAGEDRQSLAETLDQIRDKFGDNSIQRARNLFTEQDQSQ